MVICTSYFSDYSLDTESRVSKRNLYNLYKQLTNTTVRPPYYQDAKANVTEYTEVKEALYKEFVAKNLGNWIRKPQEQNMFR